MTQKKRIDWSYYFVHPFFMHKGDNKKSNEIETKIEKRSNVPEERISEEGALTFKVVLIGESGVGKTIIISSYISNTFKSQLMSTPGANFVTKNVIIEDENVSIKFEIWDTAGQERYRSLAKVFYKYADVCILVYDIKRKSYFEEIKNYWIKEIKENAPLHLS